MKTTENIFKKPSKTIYTFSFLILFTISNVVLAQKPWSLSVRPAASFATEKLGGASTKTGLGFEGTIGYCFMPHVEAYGGWSWNRFPADKLDFEETGYCYGFRLVHPIATTKLQYMLRLGGLYNHIEVEDANGKIIGDTGHGFGWELEAGIAVPLKNNWYLTPGIRYRSLSRDVKIAHTSTSLDLRYISAGIDVSWRFGK